MIVSEDSEYLKSTIILVENFLIKKLDLKLHPQKTEIRKFSHGIDFLGYVVLPYYITLRTKTQKRMFRKIKENKIRLNKDLITKKSFEQSLQSYYGMLKNCDSYKLKRKLDKFIKNLD